MSFRRLRIAIAGQRMPFRRLRIAISPSATPSIIPRAEQAAGETAARVIRITSRAARELSAALAVSWERRSATLLQTRPVPSIPRSSFVERLLTELPSLWRAARRLTRSEQDAEDLVQATVVRAIERRDDLRDEERMRAWLLRVERTVLLNAARGARQRFEVIEGGRGAESVPEPRGDLEAEILDRGFADEVDRALARLPEEWREALLLREVEDLSYEEIADLQACPVGTVRSRLSRARLALLDGLSQRREETSWQGATAIGSRASRRGTTAR